MSLLDKFSAWVWQPPRPRQRPRPNRRAQPRQKIAPWRRNAWLKHKAEQDRLQGLMENEAKVDAQANKIQAKMEALNTTKE